MEELCKKLWDNEGREKAAQKMRKGSYDHTYLWLINHHLKKKHTN